MRVLESGEDDLCRTLYTCPECRDDSLLGDFKFCSNCGKEITEFVARCSAYIDDKIKPDYVRCKLEMGHSDEVHGGYNLDGDFVTWDGD
jgi:predicted amidophosphoribosyltransferase